MLTLVVLSFARFRSHRTHGSMTLGRTTSFKAGHTTGLIATHSNDIGTIRSASITWIPNSVMTLLYGENLFIEEVKIAQFLWQESRLRTDEITTLCPASQRTGLVTPFYGETTFSRTANCSFSFKGPVVPSDFVTVSSVVVH